MSKADVGSREAAWNDFDAAVWRAQALGWNLTAWTASLLNGHWERHAKRMSELDRAMWGPVLNLARADRVSLAVRYAGAWDDAIVACGLVDFLVELEHEGRTNKRLGDTVAGWREAVEGARDAMAGAAVELLAATLVAVGGGPRPDAAATELMSASRRP
jgi:hypothetical protein